MTQEQQPVHADKICGWRESNGGESSGAHSADAQPQRLAGRIERENSRADALQRAKCFALSPAVPRRVRPQ